MKQIPLILMMAVYLACAVGAQGISSEELDAKLDTLNQKGRNLATPKEGERGGILTTFESWIIILTLVYVAATLSLFGVTAYQIHHYRKELRHRAILDMAAANREILILAIEHRPLLKIFSTGKDEEEEMISRYAQLWINHAHAIWHSSVVGHISAEEWFPVKEDILKMFHLRAIKSRWESTKWAYSRAFRAFIDDYLKKPLDDAASSDIGYKPSPQ